MLADRKNGSSNLPYRCFQYIDDILVDKTQFGVVCNEEKAEKPHICVSPGTKIRQKDIRKL